MKLYKEKLNTDLLIFEYDSVLFQEPIPKETPTSEILIKVSELTGLYMEEVLASDIQVKVWRT